MGEGTSMGLASRGDQGRASCLLVDVKGCIAADDFSFTRRMTAGSYRDIGWAVVYGNQLSTSGGWYQWISLESLVSRVPGAASRGEVLETHLPRALSPPER